MSLFAVVSIASTSFYVLNSYLKKFVYKFSFACFKAAAVELKLVEGETSEGLIIALVVTTALLVAVMMVVKTVTCSMIPYLESVASVSIVRDVNRSPHEVMIHVINVTWLIGTVFLPGLFVTDLIIMTWIKFSFFAVEAAYAATFILLPLLIIILAFGIVFLKQTITPDKACILLSKGNKNYDKNSLPQFTTAEAGIGKAGRKESDPDSVSSYSSFGTNWSSGYGEEDLMLLAGNRFPIYTSYGATLPTTNLYNPIMALIE